MIHAELHLAFRNLAAPEAELIKGLNDATDRMIPPDLLDVTVRNAGRSLKWLTDRGAEFTELRFKPQPPDRVWGRIKPGGIHDLSNSGVKRLALNLESRIKEKGATILYETKAIKLLTNVKGEVIGLRAHDKDGRFNIRAKAVILCTGGYEQNTEMLVKYIGPRGDEIIRYVGPWGTGDGFKMCEEVGAAMRSMNHAAFSHYYSADAYWKEDLLGAYLDAVANQGTIVNRDGNRFVDESLGPRIVGPLMTKTSIYKTGWIIIDNAIYSMPDVKAKVDDVREFGGTVHTADTIEEVAKRAGIGPRLSLTISEFNKAATEGKTAELEVPRAKTVNKISTGPFYAIPFVPGIVATYGGVLVNRNAQVLDWDKKPIPGLYAAGLSMVGSLCGGTENSAGAYVGFQAVCLIFGLLAAESVVKR